MSFSQKEEAGPHLSEARAPKHSNSYYSISAIGDPSFAPLLPNHKDRAGGGGPLRQK